jgi:hypothetical protein
MAENQARHFIHAWLPAGASCQRDGSLNAVYQRQSAVAPNQGGQERGLAGPKPQAQAGAGGWRRVRCGIADHCLFRADAAIGPRMHRGHQRDRPHGVALVGMTAAHVCTLYRSCAISELRGAPQQRLSFRWCATRSYARRRGSHWRVLGKRHLDYPVSSLSAPVFAPVVRREEEFRLATFLSMRAIGGCRAPRRGSCRGSQASQQKRALCRVAGVDSTFCDASPFLLAVPWIASKALARDWLWRRSTFAGRIGSGRGGACGLGRLSSGVAVCRGGLGCPAFAC